MMTHPAIIQKYTAFKKYIYAKKSNILLFNRDLIKFYITYEATYLNERSCKPMGNTGEGKTFLGYLRENLGA